MEARAISAPATNVKQQGAQALRAQRTPAFMLAIVDKALKEMTSGPDVGLQPQGGSTDVGSQNLSRAWDTCWPLVREVIKVRSE